MRRSSRSSTRASSTTRTPSTPTGAPSSRRWPSSRATCWPRCAARPGRPTARGSSARSIPRRRRRRQPQRQGQRQGRAAPRPRSPAGPRKKSAPRRYDTSRAFLLIRSYRIRGHLEADLDPLGLVRQAPHRELDPATYGFGESRLGPPDPDLRLAGAGRVPRPCARSWTACARPTAARSASSTCTSPIPTRRRGSRSASSTSRTAPSSPSRAAA